MTEFSTEEPAPKPEEIEPAGELAPQPQEQDETSEGEKGVVKLSQPSKELATRLLSKVSFKERIIGYRSHPMHGDELTSIYSFEEAARFLDAGDLSGQGWVNSIPFDTLKKWVGETLGDTELASAIGEIAKEGDQPMRPYLKYLKSIELIEPIKELMEQRLEQCKEIVGEETKA